MNYRAGFCGVPYCEQPWAGDPAARPQWDCKTKCCLAPASPESDPLGLKMQSNPSSLSDIKRLREALEKIAGPQDANRSYAELFMRAQRIASEALSSVVGEGGEGLNSSCSNLECDGESAATESPSPTEKGAR